MDGRWRAGLAAALLWMAAVGCGAAEPDGGPAAWPGEPGWVEPTSGPGGVGWPEAPLGEGAVARTLGSGRADFDAGPVALAGGSPAWEGPTGYERPGDRAGFWPYATAAELPEGGVGFVSWRALNPIYPAEFFVPGDSRYVAIEYKDNLISPRLDPFRPKGDGPSVAIGSVKLGELEARRDHRWKRVVLAIPPGAPREADGRYRVRIGGGIYGQNEIYGSVLIHRLIAARGPIPPRGAEPGFWPRTIPVMADGRLYDRSGAPYVPIVVNQPAAVNDARQYEAAVLIGANTNIATGYAEGNGRRGWGPGHWTWVDSAGEPQEQMGITTLMDTSVRLGLFTVPHAFNDTWQYFVTNIGRTMRYGGEPYAALYDGTWRGVLRVWELALRTLVAGNPHVPFVYLKDEWDHENQWWGSLEEQVVELRAVANRVAPGVPTAVTTMGWKPLMHLAGFDLADIQMTDHYPEPANLQSVALFAESMRRQARGRAFFNIVALSREYEARTTPDKWLGLDYLRPAVYMSLVHGGRGVWLWGSPAGMNHPEAAAYYRSLRPLTDELRALADVIHGEAVELGRTVATARVSGTFYPERYRAEGDGVSLTDGVATAYRRSAGRRVLLTVNEWNQPLAARLAVSSVRRGQPIPVLFEGRTVIADQDGSFVDVFAPFERHVYEIP
ncbi:MAG TPA: hypothetical protein VNM66_06150 [Thermodesulfobacteriota bacterium]|nr:hypothetical protein [Thermodesulfobacteriota bacterium]